MFLIRKGNRSQRASMTLCAILSMFLFFGTGYAQDKAKKNLLVLHSYHPSLSWTDSIMKGMQEELIQKGEPVQLHVEYMDTRRYSGKEYRQKIETLLLQKLANKHFDLVLLSDNDALDFLLKHRKGIAPNAPIIFCGINNFSDSIIAGQRKITGVAEEVSVHETIDTALKLHPGTKEIIVIGRTILPADRANREAFLSLLQSYKQSVKFTFWDNLSANELRKHLPSLQSGSLVFINGLTSDETGRQLLYDETTRLIRESSTIPLYSLWDVYLGYGIIGGKLVSGYLQGKLAGELAVRVLRGEDPEKIPVIRREAANKFMFDYRELSRFGLSVKDLPQGSEVINTPSSFYVVNKMYIWAGIVSLLIFSCIIVLLGINILARKRAEEAARRLAEEKAVMAEIGRIISSSLNIDEVYARFVEEARKLIPFDGIAINIINHKESIVTVPYVLGIGVIGDVFPLEGSVTGEATQTRSSLIIQMKDKKELEARFPTLLTTFQVGVRTLIIVPLISKDQAIGAIHFRSAKPNAFSEQDLKLAERIANQIAGAIANAQLFSERKQAEEALLKSEQRFLVFMEHLPAGVFIKDQSGRLLFANRYLQETFGWQEFIGKPTEELLPREIAEKMIADDRRVLTEGPMVIHERITDIRGSEHFFDTYKFPIPVEGASALLGGIAVDMTERKQAEEALRESAEQYHIVTSTSMDGFAIVDATGHLLDVNEAYSRMVGYSRDELLKMSVSDIEAIATPEEILTQHQKNRAGAQLFESRHRRKDGRIIDVEVSMTIMRQLDQVLVFLRDITERKQAEEAVRESEEKYRNLVETTSDWIWETDAEGNYSYTSPRVRDLLGYEPDEVIGRKPFDFMPPDEAKRIAAEFGRLSAERQPFFNLENVNLRKDGTQVILETSGVPRLDPQGNLLGYRGIDRDITKRKRAEEALRQSEKKYRSVIENIQDVFYRSDLKGCLLMGSPSGAKMFGYDTIDEMIGLPLDSLWPDPENRKRLLAQIKETGGVKDFEAVLKRKDGTTFDASFTTHFYYDDNGNLLGTEGIIRNITERKRAEEALRESEERFKGLFEQSPFSTQILDANGWTLQVNKGWEQLWNSTPDMLANYNMLQDPQLEESGTLEYLKKAFSGEAVRIPPIEYSVEKQVGKGPALWVQARAFPVKDDSGNIREVILMHEDFTEQRRAEEALRESETRFRRMVESSPLAIGVANQDARLEYVNPKFVENFGYTIEDVPTLEDWFRLAYPNPTYRQRVAEEWQILLQRAPSESQAAQGMEVELTCKDGSVRAIEVFGTPMGSKTLAVFNDLTERKQAEEERSKLETQMREIQKLESLGVLAGGIAHDFNNLLMAVLGNADLALLSLSPVSPARQNIEEIVKASQRAADLCRQMLAYSGRGRFVLGRYDLSEIVQEMSHMLQVSISKKATLRYRFATGLPAVEADATQLRQVIMNLITNASDALDDTSGVIEVSSGVMECDRVYLSESYLADKLSEGRYVYLEVSDTGCGMDAETRSRIFDPFFTTKFTGRGLGLAAVLGIVRGHKGAIKVYSEPGKGTTIKVLFPAVEWKPADRAQIAEQSILPPSGGTILLVDDDQAVLNVGSIMLEHLGFTVLTASDGQEGLEVFREREAEIDCVLLDLTMPRMSGEEVFQEMRRIRSDVRVILSSGYNEQEVTQRFAGKGLTGFVQKPYTLAKLREILKRALG